MQDGLLANQTAASMRAVFAPKVCGALRLAEAAAALPMRYVLCIARSPALRKLVLQLRCTCVTPVSTGAALHAHGHCMPGVDSDLVHHGSIAYED